MAAAWVQLAVLVFCSTTITVVTTAEDGLEIPLQGPPDKPINVRFESVNFNHTLRWDLAPNHDNSTLFTVQYIGAGHRESYPSPEEWQEKAKCINITGLCCVLLNEIGRDGNWWARVRAFNSYGTSDWAESKLFEPFEDTLIGAPDLDIQAGEVTTERIVLRVRAPKTPIYDSDTGRRMRISNIYTSIKWNITYQEVGSSFKMEKITSDKDVVLDHLYPGKRYCIAVYGSYLGRKGATRRICADTKEDVPSSGARDLFSRVDDCTRYPLRNVRLTWQPPAEEDWNGELLQYKISYREIGSFSSEMTHSLVPAGVTNFTIRDLSASKRYVVDVAACTSAGCSETPLQHEMPRVEPFQTATSPPYAPNVSASPLSSTSMQISWSPLEDACVQGYMVQYAPGVEPMNVDSGTTVNLTGLLPGTEYHVCVKARLASADVREFGDCDRKSGVYARTMESADDANILVQTVVPILAVVTVLLVLLCFAVLWMRGSPFLSISKINIVLPPVLVEIKETKDSAWEPISSSSNSERMDDLGSLRTSMIRQKSKFVKSLQNLPDTLTLDDDVFADEKKRLLSWKSDKDLVVKVVISREKCEDKDEPSTPTSTDSGNVSGPCSLITDSGGDEKESGSGGSVTTYHLDSPVKKNFLDPSMESPRDSKKLVVPQVMTSWPDNQTSSSEIESYVRATDGTFEDDADEVFPAKGCKSQSNPYVLAENLPLLAPPFTQEFKPNTNPQVTAGAPPPNPPSQRGMTDLPVPNLLSHTPGANSPPAQSMSSGSSIDPYVVSAVPLPSLPVPRAASNPAGALDSPSSSSTSSVDPYVQAASGPRGWQNPPASSTVSSPSMSSQSDVDPYIQASTNRQANRPSATQRPPDGLHRPSNNLNSSSDTSRNRDYQDPWLTR
ncbi:hypothetical protein Bbelb_326350 [Branchiostoma belcheri]|nr:hypothetical protein Bbelb_326350 [Branchiostoma belcheri]